MTEDSPVAGVCVVTHPLAAAGENATRSLLDVLSALTAVSLVTADLPTDSEIRGRHEVIHTRPENSTFRKEKATPEDTSGTGAMAG